MNPSELPTLKACVNHSNTQPCSSKLYLTLYFVLGMSPFLQFVSGMLIEVMLVNY